MNYHILILVLISFCVHTVNAQKNGLQVIKYKNQKTKLIKENSKIRIISEGKTIKGAYTLLNDSTILLQTDTILLKQISEIRYKKFSTLLGGGSLLLTGAYLTAAGIFGVAMTSAEGAGIGFLIGMVVFSPLYVGGALLITSGIILLVHGKKYATSKWKYKLVRTIPAVGLN